MKISKSVRILLLLACLTASALSADHEESGSPNGVTARAKALFGGFAEKGKRLIAFPEADFDNLLSRGVTLDDDGKLDASTRMVLERFALRFQRYYEQASSSLKSLDTKYGLQSFGLKEDSYSFDYRKTVLPKIELVERETKRWTALAAKDSRIDAFLQNRLGNLWLAPEQTQKAKGSIPGLDRALAFLKAPQDAALKALQALRPNGTTLTATDRTNLEIFAKKYAREYKASLQALDKIDPRTIVNGTYNEIYKSIEARGLAALKENNRILHGLKGENHIYFVEAEKQIRKAFREEGLTEQDGTSTWIQRLRPSPLAGQGTTPRVQDTAPVAPPAPQATAPRVHATAPVAPAAPQSPVRPSGSQPVPPVSYVPAEPKAPVPPPVRQMPYALPIAPVPVAPAPVAPPVRRMPPAADSAQGSVRGAAVLAQSSVVPPVQQVNSVQLTPRAKQVDIVQPPAQVPVAKGPSLNAQGILLLPNGVQALRHPGFTPTFHRGVNWSGNVGLYQAGNTFYEVFQPEGSSRIEVRRATNVRFHPSLGVMGWHAVLPVIQ